MEWKTIPFYLRDVHESSDTLLRSFARCTGRTVPAHRRTLTPKDGEIILSVYKRPRSTQISVHPRFLVPWEPVENDEAVVIKGPLLGVTGVVKSKDGSKCMVAFQVDNDTLDYSIEESELASIEDFTG